jgi:hypothetical protein
MTYVQPASLLGIPAEIRLQIYSYLLDDGGTKIFQIRSESPNAYATRQSTRRSTFRVLGGVLYLQSQLTTYYLSSAVNLHTSILSVNRLLSEEATPLIYNKHTFDFGSNVEAIVPFLSDLRPSTRSLLQEIAILKKSSVFTRDFDRCEWVRLLFDH